MCSYSNNVEKMLFSNCNLFMRSFTNKGIGIAFNSEIGKILFKKSSNFGIAMEIFMVNNKRKVSKMKSAGSEHALKVLIETNLEAVETFEKTKSLLQRVGDVNLKPIHIPVSLHNPKEPANIRGKSFKMPLGHSTVVYITPNAREIDDSARELSEAQRGCRLSKDSQSLDIFNIYSQEACLLECLIKQAFQRCKCIPWNYLSISKVFVLQVII